MDTDNSNINSDTECECVICLEPVNKIKNFKCKKCQNVFHTKCIYDLKEKKCPLCREKIVIVHKSKYNFIFNNMNDNDVYDIDKYINKWGRKTCLENKHKFCLETLGDWGIDYNTTDLKFKYTCMHIQCVDCDISTIMK